MISARYIKFTILNATPHAMGVSVAEVYAKSDSGFDYAKGTAGAIISGTTNNGNYPPSMAIDGAENANASGNPAASYMVALSQSFTVDLGGIKSDIETIGLRTSSWDTNWGSVTSYSVSYSVDNVSFINLDIRSIPVISGNNNYATDLFTTVDKVKTNVGSMQIGDRIAFEYTTPTAGQVGSFANLGSATKELIPAVSSATPDGTAYFIHAGYDSEGKMKLVCDRNIQHSISWDTINAAGLVNGVEVQIGNKKGIMRLMTGGISASDTDNEWDQIIVKSTLGNTITAGDNTVWSWQNIYSLTSTTQSSSAMCRGHDTDSYSAITASETSMLNSEIGFRPIILLDVQVNNFNLESIEPYHVYPQQHESFIVKLNVTNQETSQPSSFKILKNGAEVSGSSTNSSRTIPVSLLSDGLNTLSIETIDPVENLGSFNIYKEQLYRSTAERTFSAKEEGYAAKNVLHSSGSAKRKTAAANKPPLNSGVATITIDSATNKITVV